MSRSVLRRTLVAAVSSSVIAVGVSAVPASAQTTHQNGLVNVALTNTTVQIPVGVAANVCNVTANVLATNPLTTLTGSPCTSVSNPSASGGGGGGGNTNQQGLVNVSLTNTTVQVPIGIAANVCNVAANVLATTPVTLVNNSQCMSVTNPGATA
jgi:hypothetical protein